MKTKAQLDREIAQVLSRPRGATRSRSHATRRKLPDRYEVVETIDGDWMILVDGVQTGSKRDRSGAGSDTYPTYEAAHEAAVDLAIQRRVVAGSTDHTRQRRRRRCKDNSIRCTPTTTV